MKYQNVHLHNVWDLIPQEDGKEFSITRLPLEIHDKINQGAKNMSFLGSACEIRGVLKHGGEARFILKAMDDNVVPPTALVYRGEFLERAIALAIGENTEIVVKDTINQKTMENLATKNQHAFHPKMIRVLLPPIHPVRVVRIEGDLSLPKAKHLPEKTLLCYGSSITHGASAVSPSGTYAAQCARLMGMDLIDLGLGGAAQMDMPIAKHIAKRKDWNMATLEMGINVRNWPVDQFQTAVEAFVETIVASHPKKYVFCIDQFTNNWDLSKENLAKAKAFRKVVRKLVEKINSKYVFHIDGRKLLRDPRGLWTDLVHPHDHGMHEMGSRLASHIKKKALK